LEFVKKTVLASTGTLCPGIKGFVSKIMAVYICRQSSPVEVDLIDITVSLRLKDKKESDSPVRVLKLHVRLSC
jgi:hypothetical protein